MSTVNTKDWFTRQATYNVIIGEKTVIAAMVIRARIQL